MLQSRYKGKKPIRNIDMTKSANGRCVKENGKIVESRPKRSPVFHKRNPSGIKVGGWNMRGDVLKSRTDKI